MTPVTFPEGLGQIAVSAATAAGAGLSADWHNHTVMPPVVCFWPKCR